MTLKKIAMALGALALILLIALDTHAQAPSVQAPGETDAKCPTLDVSGLKSNEGMLMVAAYTSAEAFFKKPAWTTMQEVSGSTMQIPVCGLNVEEFAVTAVQDLNGNRKLDTNPVGVPTEPYAASGTPSMFGAPTWKDTKVAYKGASALIPIKF
jgi:uncharacterized protein (DUF2141 family)